MSLELDFQFVTQHRGRRDEFVRRYNLAAADACAVGGEAHSSFCADLLAYAADERNLMAAADHVRRRGGTAPGPDGLLLSDFSKVDLWDAIRELRDRVRGGEYERGPLKRCEIPKPNSTEKRIIYLMNVLDRIVGRGAAQILRPLLQSITDPLSFCWWRRGAQMALAYAQRRLIEDGRVVWIVEDARQAFDRVPRPRLRQILRRYVPNCDFCQLTMNLVEPPKPLGILQGASLSSLLLDVYFTHLLHRPWRQDVTRPPLVRYMDDVLVACRPDDDAGARYRQLNRFFGDAGMQPKHGQDKAIRDLRFQTVTWLGYKLRFVRCRLEIRPKHFCLDTPEDAQRTHKLLFQKFARLHERREGWRFANSLLRSLVLHLGPTLPFVDPEAIYRTIAGAAQEAGFEELVSYRETLAQWQSNHDRWLAMCQRVGEYSRPTTK